MALTMKPGPRTMAQANSKLMQGRQERQAQLAATAPTTAVTAPVAKNPVTASRTIKQLNGGNPVNQATGMLGSIAKPKAKTISLKRV